MANKKHLEILKRGSSAWNQWRMAHPNIHPDLSEANLARAELSHFDLSNVDLKDADLRLSYFGGGMLAYANLNGAILICSTLNTADLSSANLKGADLTCAELHKAQLCGADLSDSRLLETNFNYSDLKGANFDNATVARTVFGNNDLSTTKGLETVYHAGPSTIGVNTIYLSKGNIPEIFLRGAGLPDNFISYMKSLTSDAIQFYSCFISYSSSDQPFAERLHSDLQNRGVRCWFAPVDLRIGDRFRQKIDESIRLHDKLLLILSKNSISSPWVEEEVENSMERERIDNRPVLFPIRIDNSALKSKQAWAASLRRLRHIGDFTGWKTHDSYQMAFQRLLRDLKANEAETNRA